MIKTKKITKETKEQIVKTYKSKPITLMELANLFGLSEPTVLKILKEYRVELWKKNRLFSPELQEDYFSTIDSHEKAYFLGLITTDGCVFWKNKKNAFLSIELKASDKYILEEFMRLMKCNRKLVFNKKSRTYTATITSSKLVKQLENYNIKSNSSFTQEMSKNIPSEYLSSYIRGIIDGDGSFGFYSRPNRKVHSKSMRLCSGSKIFLEQFIDVLTQTLNIEPVEIHKNKKDHTFSIEIKRNNDLETLINFLYKSDNEPCLLRKREIAEKILSEIRQYRDNHRNMAS